MENGSKAGMGVLNTMGIAFIVLKLIGIITWSWFWVLFPFILQAVIIFLGLILALLTISSDR